MKKIISMLLAVFMLGMLTSCPAIDITPSPVQSPSTEASDSSEPSITEILGDDIPEHLKGLDFGGEEIGIIMSGDDVATRSILLPQGDDETYSVNVAVRFRNEVIEKLLNVDIVPKEVVQSGEMVKHIREYLCSPDTSYDIIGVYQFYDLGLAYGADIGSIFAFNLIDEKDMYIKADADYWDTDTYDLLTYNGNSRLITGDLSLTWLTSMYVSYVNAEMWKLYEDDIRKITGVDGDIYSLVYEGKWTLDLWLQLNELVHKNKDGNDAAVTCDDQVGFVGYGIESGLNNIIVDGLFSGCHVTFSKMDSDGKPVMDYDNDVLKKYADKTKELYNGSKSCLIVNGSGTDDTQMSAMDVFASGNALMTVDTLGAAEDALVNMASDRYYILPPPKADESQSDYATTFGRNTNHFGIISGCENLGAATATLEALGYYSKKIVTPEVYDIALKGRYTRGDSDKAAKMIDFIRSKTYSDFVLLWEGSMSESPTWYLRKNIGTDNVALEAVVKQEAWSRDLRALRGLLEDKPISEN